MSRYFSFLDHEDHITQRFLIKREINKIKSDSLGLVYQTHRTGACQMLSLYLDDHVVFVFYSMVCYINWFLDIKPALHSRDKLCTVMVYTTFLYVVSSILLRIFVSVFI